MGTRAPGSKRTTCISQPSVVAMSFTNTPAANVDGRHGRSPVFTHRKAPRSSALIVVTSPPHVGGHLAEPVAEGGRDELGLLERGQVAAVIKHHEAGSRDPRRHHRPVRHSGERVVSTPQQERRAARPPKIIPPVSPPEQRSILSLEDADTET